MANYIAHHTKKKRILARKEADLLRLINSHRPADKLIAAAEVVRDARIRVLKVRRSIIVPGGDAASQTPKLTLKSNELPTQRLLQSYLNSVTRLDVTFRL